MLTDSLTLNLSTVHTLIRWRRAEPHPVLAATPAWRAENATRVLDQQAIHELDQNKLLRRGRPDADLDDAIGALVRPDHEYYGWITTTVDGRPLRYGVLAVAAYQQGLLVFRNYESGTVVLAAARPGELASVFLAQLPMVAPASGRPVSAPYQDFLAADAPTGDGFTGFGTKAGSAVLAVRAVLDQPRTGGGSLYAAGRVSSLGARRRCRQPINYLDTGTGRWLSQLDTTPQGVVATLQPAGTDLLAARITLADRQLGRPG